MSNRIDKQVGETFVYNNITLKVEKDPIFGGCTGCYFLPDYESGCDDVCCLCTERKTGDSVIFTIVEKGGNA